MVFLTLNLINKELLRFLSGNLLVFLNAYHKVPQSEHSEKELLITTKKINMWTFAKPT
jgi:hypothetical protein